MGGRIGGVRSFLVGAVDGFLRHNPSALARQLRGRRHRTSCLLDTAVVVRSPDHFSCGLSCALYHGTYVLNGPGKMEMGDRSHLGAMCYVNVLHGTLRIGDDVVIGPHTSIIIYSNDFGEGQRVSDLRRQGDVHIGNNVFIGANCTILPGARIRDNVVVGAGSVVTGELAPNTVYAGAPCRPIRHGWFRRHGLNPEDMGA